MKPGLEEYATCAGRELTPTLIASCNGPGGGGMLHSTIEFDRLPFIPDKDNKYQFICL